MNDTTPAQAVEKKHCSFIVKILATIGAFTVLSWIVIIIGIGIFWYTDPLDLNNITLDGIMDGSMIPDELAPLLSNTGIDVEALMNTDVEALEICMRESVGDDRVALLDSGAQQPGIGDVLALKNCLQ
jgi:hypothetical protein